MKKLSFILPALFALLLCAAVPAAGQSATASSPGVTIKGVVQDAENKSTLPGAVVTLKFGNDSLQMATIKGGKFEFNKIPEGSFRLKITFIGYNPVDIGYKAEGAQIDMGYIQLVPGGVEMDKVTIVSQITMMTLDGDTIKYDPRAFATAEGDYAIDLVTKMPGIDIDEEGKITAHGKEVKWTLVDGRLLFGSNAMTALEMVKADNVEMVKVYDVANPEQAGAELKSGKDGYQRVIDLQTKTKIKMATDAQAFVGIGADIEREGNVPDFRYKGGGRFGLFNDKYNILASGYFNNTKENSNRTRVTMEKAASLSDMTNTSPGYGRRNDFQVMVSNRNSFDAKRKWQGSVGYRLYDTYDRTSNSLESIYLPNSNDEVRTELSDNSEIRKYNNHNVNLEAFTRWDGGRFSISPAFTFTDASRVNNGLETTLMNDIPTARRLTSSTSSSYTKSTNGSMNYSNLLVDYQKLKAMSESQQEIDKRMFTPHLFGNASWQYSDVGEHGWRLDSTLSKRNTYVSSSDGYTKYVSTSWGISDLKLTQWLGISANYNFSYNDSKTKKIEIDEITMLPDLSLSRLHTVKDMKNTGSVTLDFNDYPHKLRVSLGVRYESTYRSQLEKTPLYIDESRNFDAILPSIHIDNSGGKQSIADKKYFYFSYSPSVSQPSVEQMRAYFDDTDSKYITFGNPNLKQTYSHDFSVGYNLGSFNSSQTIGISAYFSYEERGVVSKTKWYNGTDDRPVVIPGYGTVIQPTQLRTYDNIDGELYGGINGNISRPVIGNKFVLRSSVSYGYSKTPMYIDEVFVKSNYNNGGFNFNLKSNYSRTFEYSLSGSSTYSHTRYSGGAGTNSHGFRQRAGAAVDINFLKNFFFATEYTFNYVNRSTLESETQNNLNASIAYKFHKRAGELNFAVLDILNQKSSYSAYVDGERTVRSYAELMGRYYMLTLSYRFNTTGSGAKGAAPARRGPGGGAGGVRPSAGNAPRPR